MSAVLAFPGTRLALVPDGVPCSCWGCNQILLREGAQQLRMGVIPFFEDGAPADAPAGAPASSSTGEHP